MSEDKDVVIKISAKNETGPGFGGAKKALLDLARDAEGAVGKLRGFAKEHDQSFKAVGQAIGIAAAAAGALGGPVVAPGIRSRRTPLAIALGLYGNRGPGQAR